jgi:hypothetical protein
MLNSELRKAQNGAAPNIFFYKKIYCRIKFFATFAVVKLVASGHENRCVVLHSNVKKDGFLPKKSFGGVQRFCGWA